MELLKHECGVAMVRLLKPVEYYQQKYKNSHWGLDKLYLLMEKQHNRGQEGAGIAVVKLDASPGNEYMFRERAEGSQAITKVYESLRSMPEATGNLYMGHLRYSTTGRKGLKYVHPFLRRNNWRARNLAVCGNFNMTNTEEIFQSITAMGQHPRIMCDTYILLEQLGHRLDRESERVCAEAVKRNLKGVEVTDYIENNIDVLNILSTAAPVWDGGYVICGLTGSGEMFAMRDPKGIRTAFYYKNDEVFVLASERAAIQTAFAAESADISELEPGEGIVITKHCDMRTRQILECAEKKACSFERIYFSRGSDEDIYRERKQLGYRLTGPILKAIDGDIDNTVFGYIPNTAEVAFYGMTDGFKEEYNHRKINEILALGHMPERSELTQILGKWLRTEKVAVKDIKLRTFITEESARNDLSAHVYDITYGSLRPYQDNLVIIDDSIVRGTTLRESVIGILDRLHPKKIVIVSSAPQVRYPDFYGIDMPKMEEFIAFKAAIALLEQRGMRDVIDRVYAGCVSQRESADCVNLVKEIYAPFDDDEISAKIVEMLQPPTVKTPVQIVFQTLEGLRQTCANHTGDWYFSGEYPTPGGLRLLNESFINFYENTCKNI